YDGAQDYDLLLRLLERTGKIFHIPKVLYHWRMINTSTSFNQDAKDYANSAGKAALEESLRRRRIEGEVQYTGTKYFYRVKRVLAQRPLISIIIPFKDKQEYTEKCIHSILKKSHYQNFEIIGISNNSIDNNTFEMMKRLEKADDRVKFLELNIPFNYSKINNYAASLANGSHIVLMNNDIEINTDGWIEALLEHSQRDKIGAVGAKLYYPNNTVQHAGVILGIAGFAGHSHRHAKRNSPGYFNRLNCVQNVSAVTGALLMVKKYLYERVGGLDEDNLGIALNDIDFCLKLRKIDLLNILTPYCEAYHYESASRGYESSPGKITRFENEIKYFKKKWRDYLAQGDPYYNCNLTLSYEDFSLNFDKNVSQE
ncbi:MAG: glycosyltransferase, partial [Desulfobacterales bacterium]